MLNDVIHFLFISDRNGKKKKKAKKKQGKIGIKLFSYLFLDQSEILLNPFWKPYLLAYYSSMNDKHLPCLISRSNNMWLEFCKTILLFTSTTYNAPALLTPLGGHLFCNNLVGGKLLISGVNRAPRKIYNGQGKCRFYSTELGKAWEKAWLRLMIMEIKLNMVKEWIRSELLSRN